MILKIIFYDKLNLPINENAVSRFLRDRLSQQILQKRIIIGMTLISVVHNILNNFISSPNKTNLIQLTKSFQFFNLNFQTFGVFRIYD